LNFLSRRVLTSIVVVFAALNLDFIIPRLAPGNAAEILASGTKLPAQAVALLSARFGLNQPVWVQYALYMQNILTHWPPFFGYSFQFYPTPVSELVFSRLEWTLLLISVSFFLSIGLTNLLGGITATRRGGKAESISVYSSIIFFSTPAFWIALILVSVFAVNLRWFPLIGNADPVSGTVPYLLSALKHAVLPIATMTLVTFGQIFLILRGTAQEVLRSDYVTAAKARGLKDWTIGYDYVVKNSLLPIVSLMGYLIATLISVDIIVEFVFGYGGIGDLIVDGILNRDYPVLEGSFFYITILVVGGALLGDFLLTRLDPRLRGD
jgi:peptide/nickel transport system permease protein